MCLFHKLRGIMKRFQHGISSWLNVSLLWVIFHTGSCLTSLEACEDFGGRLSIDTQSWALEDCIKVWEAWIPTIYSGARKGILPHSHDDILHHGYPDREVFQPISTLLRSQGTPCMVKGMESYDGVGSSTIRHISSWLYAKELGCDWISPDFNQGDVSHLSDPARPKGLYCHRTEWVYKFNASAPMELGKERRRCAQVTWLNFFRLNRHSILPPDAGITRVVQVCMYGTSKVRQK